jgi:uncharacterized protein (TIGR02001 family)
MKWCGALAAVALGAVTAEVCADEAASPWSGNVAVASQYVSRGFQQSWGQPALQGGMDYATPSGWFAGTWLSTVSPYFVEGGHLEWDLYAGYAGSGGDLSYRAGLYCYRYPGAKVSATGTPLDYGEIVLGLDWRHWSLAYSITATRDYFGFNSQTLGIGRRAHSRGSTYLDLGRHFELPGGYVLALHYGWQRVNHFADYSWRDASVALSRGIAGFDVEAGYARAWNGAGVYARYSTGVPDGRGRVHVSDPIDGAWFLKIAHTF